jgi:hypothetical protein
MVEFFVLERLSPVNLELFESGGEVSSGGLGHGYFADPSAQKDGGYFVWNRNFFTFSGAACLSFGVHYKLAGGRRRGEMSDTEVATLEKTVYGCSAQSWVTPSEPV